MAEYLARVTWESILQYRLEKGGGKRARKGPRRLPLTDQYGSDQRALDKLNYKDGLWLFTAPTFGRGRDRRTLPPSVLGRISITHAWNRGTREMHPAKGTRCRVTQKRNTKKLSVADYKYWRCGTRGKALPVHNAFPLFRSLTFEGRVKEVDPNCEGCNLPTVPTRGPFGHLMLHFQSIRALTPESAARLGKLESHVKAGRTLFLSHRQEEAGRHVGKVAAYLSDDALIWWDIQSLPQSRKYIDGTLKRALDDGIRQARWFVVFLTPTFGTSKWTRNELGEALQLRANPGLLGGPRILPVLLGGSLMGDIETEEPISVGRGPKAIASAIRERIEAAD